MSPRSILKRSTDSTPCSTPSPNHQASAAYYNSALPYQPHVHFPPTSALTQTFTTHSGSQYDRAPIVVLPNDCALPERGCPGRTYDGGEARMKSSSCRSSRRDCRSSRTSGGVVAKDVMDVRSISSRPPPLVPDVSSSESDESDGLSSPPEFTSTTSTSLRHYSHHHHHSIPPTQEHLDKALAFLPHPPTPTTKDRSKRRSSANVTPRFKSEDGARSFAASSLDGCLGGF